MDEAQTTDGAALLAVALEAARAAAAVAMHWRERLPQLHVEEKSGPSDLVSRADREAETAAREVLARQRPDDGVHGEEAGETPGTSGTVWLVDPIDGTTNYLYGRDDWCVSVAAVRDGRSLAAVVLEPVLDRATTAVAGQGAYADGVRLAVRRPAELALAVVDLGLGRAERRARAGDVVGALVPRLRDVRRGGSAAIALANVARGRSDATWSPGLQPWDLAAGVLLVAEAGGEVGDLDGPVEGLPGDEVLAGAPEVCAALRPLLAGAYG
jgi:myo-inositol-1(or 4)-monophosphatase